ncbi:MAG: hypothetical protein M3450_06540, partial [Actinomycetota bacterium]|nr:hypothetical protein [Actinomycetota bacterium]
MVRLRIYLIGAAITIAGSIALVGQAVADDHRPPQTSLITDLDRQGGQPTHMRWARRVNPDECVVSDGFGPVTFPKAVPFTLGNAVRVRLHKNEMPVEFSVEAWRSVRGDGTPRGAGHPVPAVLTPKRRDGETVAWTLQFEPSEAGHTYLQVTAYWQDETGCHPPPDLGSQSASW